MQFVESSVVGVRSAVTMLRRKGTPLRFVLFPMVHVAEPGFFEAVADGVRECDLVVAEGGPPQADRFALRLARLRWGPHVDQLVALDLESLGVPIIWPETPEPPSKVEQILNVPGTLVLWACGRGRLPRRMPGLDQAEVYDNRWAGGPVSRTLRQWILHDRDEELMTALQKVHSDRCEDSIDVAVVYGAMHMAAVTQGLWEAYRYQARSAYWITVRSW